MISNPTTIADMRQLRYCGALGHTVVVMTGPDDDRCPSLETCDKHSASLAVRTEYAARNPRIYLKRPRGRWVRWYP